MCKSRLPPLLWDFFWTFLAKSIDFYYNVGYNERQLGHLARQKINGEPYQTPKRLTPSKRLYGWGDCRGGWQSLPKRRINYMKKMRRGCDNYPDEGRYRIIEASEGWGYYVIIASDRYNEMRTYQYDGGCGTKADVEKELREHSFAEIVRRYREQYVYLECVEALR